MTEHLQPGVSADSVELVAYRRFPNWKLQMSCSWAAEGGGGSADKVVGPDTHISDKQIFHAGMHHGEDTISRSGHMQHHTRALQCLIMQVSGTTQYITTRN